MNTFMHTHSPKKTIAILGGGPSCLFILKRIVELNKQVDIEIFEKNAVIGAGMPYSDQGANIEHITNVSDNEIPKVVVSVSDWVRSLDEKTLVKYLIDPDQFTRYHVLPRLLFGQYLTAQYRLLRDIAKGKGIGITGHTGILVDDVIDFPDRNQVQVVTSKGEQFFDAVVVCTGNKWPKKHEGKVDGYYDSPYPPAKLRLKLNHPVAIKGSSLTAIDAIRTLARENGSFSRDEKGQLSYIQDPESNHFKIVMHSRNGLLPAIRFHLSEPQLTDDSLLSDEQVKKNRMENGGYLSLDFLFEKKFKDGFKQSDPKFYQRIKNLSLESFVDKIMRMRLGKDPFTLFREEYREAEKSIRKKQSIYWKEKLAEFSYILNYPAKHLSAEDMLRLRKCLLPLISVIIAFVPQSSCEELFALHQAGKLSIVPVGEDSFVEPGPKGGIVYRYKDQEGKSHNISYKTYIDCSGQPHLSYEDFPFEGLRAKKTISQAVIKFRSVKEAQAILDAGNEDVVENANGDYFLKVSGITINDYFQIVDEYGQENERIYMMGVPYIGGYNPDYSGLDFCEEASQCIVEKIDTLLLTDLGENLRTEGEKRGITV